MAGMILIHEDEAEQVIRCAEFLAHLSQKWVASCLDGDSAEEVEEKLDLIKSVLYGHGIPL